MAKQAGAGGLIYTRYTAEGVQVSAKAIGEAGARSVLEASGAKLPKIYTTNWFRKDADGKFVWPGYGENMRVLKWMIDRIEGKVQGEKHAFGISPTYDELNWEGLPFTPEQFKQVIGIDLPAWEQELQLHHELFQKLEQRMPEELKAAKSALQQRFSATA